MPHELAVLGEVLRRRGARVVDGGEQQAELHESTLINRMDSAAPDTGAAGGDVIRSADSEQRREEHERCAMEGKCLVVTGGGSGIGAAIAKRFTREGGRVAILDLDEERASRRRPRGLEGAVAIECDVADERVGRVGGRRGGGAARPDRLRRQRRRLPRLRRLRDVLARGLEPHARRARDRELPRLPRRAAVPQRGRRRLDRQLRLDRRRARPAAERRLLRREGRGRRPLASARGRARARPDPRQHASRPAAC